MSASQISLNSEQAATAHVLPFLAWLVLMLLPVAPTTNYLIRTAVSLILLLWLRPWKWYRFRLNGIMLGLTGVTAVVVFWVWVAPETEWFACRFPNLHRFYLHFGRFGVRAPTGTAFDPARCGWTLTLTRLVGSSFVIAPVEEFFWRGFLYRLLFSRAFLDVPLRTFSLWRFALLAVLFGLEHDRWLTGLVAGAAYTTLVVASGELWPALFAHVATNLLLALYVLQTGSYQFW